MIRRLIHHTHAIPSVISAMLDGSGTPTSVMVTVVVPFVNVPMPLNAGEVLLKSARTAVAIQQGKEPVVKDPLLQPVLPPFRSKRVTVPKEEVAMSKIV